ncbi:MAG: redoxin domain-containing protein, partial [Saprospiraceae bacterium]
KAKIEQARAGLQMVAEATHNEPAATAEFEQRLRATQTELTEQRSQFILAHPQDLYARILRAAQLPVPPAELPERDKTGKPNPVFYTWLQQHYWETSDFTDDRLLYNNLWPSYLGLFFSRVVAPQPDSLIHAIDALLAKMPHNGPIFQYTVKYLTQRFEQSDWRNADQVFVHLADTYQQPASTPWLDQATLLRIEEKANIQRRTLTGQAAPALTLPDVEGNAWDLSQLGKPYTLLIFYSPLCAHCQESMPGVYQTWKDFAPQGLDAVAVSMENYDFWKNYVQQKGWTWRNVADPTGKNDFQKTYNAWNLPVIYLLDKDHKITRKGIRTTDLVEVLREYFK